MARPVRLHLPDGRREHAALRQLMRRVDFDDVVRAVEKVKAEAWSEFVNRYGDWGKDMVLYLSRKHTGMRLRALGERGADWITWRWPRQREG